MFAPIKINSTHTCWSHIIRCHNQDYKIATNLGTWWNKEKRGKIEQRRAETRLTLWRLVAVGYFHKNTTETHVALRGNFSGPVSATNLVKSPKDRQVL